MLNYMSVINNFYTPDKDNWVISLLWHNTRATIVVEGIKEAHNQSFLAVVEKIDGGEVQAKEYTKPTFLNKTEVKNIRVRRNFKF